MTGTDFFFLTIIDKHLLAHASLQHTPLTRAGGRVEVVASLSRSHSCCAVRLVYTQISPSHISTTLYFIFQFAIQKKRKIKIYRSLILPVVLYGFETWSVTLSEEYRLRVFKNRMLRRILGPKRNKVTGEQRRLHNQQLYGLYCSPNIIQVIKSRRKRWVGHVVHVGERRGAYKVLVGKPEGKRPCGRPKPRREEILKWFYKKWNGEAWTGLIWLRTGTGDGLL